MTTARFAAGGPPVDEHTAFVLDDPPNAHGCVSHGTTSHGLASHGSDSHGSDSHDPSTHGSDIAALTVVPIQMKESVTDGKLQKRQFHSEIL